jgi:WD40 repeat protein
MRVVAAPIAISADGALVAAAHGASAIGVWDATNGRERPVAAGSEHDAKTSAFAFAPKGDALFVGTEAGTVVRVDLASGRWDALATGLGATVDAISVSADGRTVAVAAGHSVHVFDGVTRARVRSLDAGAPSRGLAVRADGRWLAAALWGDTVRLWSLTDGKLGATVYRGPSDRGTWVTGPDGRIDWTGDASGFASCTIGSWGVSIELCVEPFVTPGLLRRLLTGVSLD